MTEQAIIDKFIALSEGKLTAEDWKIWFSENAQSVEKICGRTAFLKIKPFASFSDTQNIYIGQTGAFNWLKSKNIEPQLSDIYKINYEKEFEDFCRSQDEKRKQVRKIVESKFGHLKEFYPKFLRQLTKSYDEHTIIEAGKTTDEIKAKEKELSVTFSTELKAFFGHISVFEFEGITINFDDLDRQLFNEKEFLVLGEFWQYGDGDKLLYNIENESINIFTHEYNPPKIIKEAKNITDFVEKTLVKHLKEYEM